MIRDIKVSGQRIISTSLLVFRPTLHSLQLQMPYLDKGITKFSLEDTIHALTCMSQLEHLVIQPFCCQERSGTTSQALLPRLSNPRVSSFTTLDPILPLNHIEIPSLTAIDVTVYECDSTEYLNCLCSCIADRVLDSQVFPATTTGQFYTGWDYMSFKADSIPHGHYTEILNAQTPLHVYVSQSGLLGKIDLSSLATRLNISNIEDIHI